MADTMKKADLLRALERVKDMSDQEIAINLEWIRDVAESAYAHIKQVSK